MDAFVCRFVAAAGELIAHRRTDGGTDDSATAEQNSIVDFGLSENRLLKRKFLLLLLALPRESRPAATSKLLRLDDLSAVFRWPDAFFNYAHEGRELEA